MSTPPPRFNLPDPPHSPFTVPPPPYAAPQTPTNPTSTFTFTFTPTPTTTPTTTPTPTPTPTPPAAAGGKPCPTCRLFYPADVFPAHPPPAAAAPARCTWCRGLRAQRCCACGVFKLQEHFETRDHTGWSEGVCVDCWPWVGIGTSSGGGGGGGGGETQRWDVVGEGMRALELELGLGLGSQLGLGGQVIGWSCQPRVPRQAVTRGGIMRMPSSAGHIGLQLARETGIVPASPASPGLRIFVGKTITCVDSTEDDVWFRARDPPTLEIVITIMQLRYPLLEDQLIRGIFLQQEGKEHLVCNGAEGGEIVWQVTIDQLLRCAPSCKVRVQTLLEGLSYKATITMCEE
ncbi:hypothetical protein DFP73DRAFT_587332 [Morchella snyderi]|nr:hypothetical protein DFP73DRAFT_587332 [Morchella snyderi]